MNPVTYIKETLGNSDESPTKQYLQSYLKKVPDGEEPEVDETILRNWLSTLHSLSPDLPQEEPELAVGTAAALERHFAYRHPDWYDGERPETLKHTDEEPLELAIRKVAATQSAAKDLLIGNDGHRAYRSELEKHVREFDLSTEQQR